MKKLFLLIAVLASFNLMAQLEPHQVDDQIQQRDWYKAHPELHNEIDRLQKQLEDELAHYQRHASAKRGEQYLIPVVFHVLHTGGAENISDEQVEDAVRILNEDFNFQNPDTADIVPAFKNVAGNPEISFRLAKIDPIGNETSGITRTFTELSNDAGENSKIIFWPREKYLNIWVVNSIASGAAGYTFYPAFAPPSRDGIMILHNYVGALGTGSARRSRALTHEVGHWINLPHVWGSTNTPGEAGNCVSDDGVGDTPNTLGWRSCNLDGETCGSLDNVQNYMDYSYCYTMFTQGQSDRMRVALTSTVAERSSLITVENHRATGVIDNVEARWELNKDVICAGSDVQFKDRSYYDQTSWEWNFEGAIPANSTDTNPTVNYSEPGTYSVSLEVGDGNRSDLNTMPAQVHVLPEDGFFTPYTENFENPAYASQLWLIRNGQLGIQNGWEYSTFVGYEGNHCLVNRNYGSDPGRVDEFVSTTMDWSSFESAILNFNIAFRQRTQDDKDRLRIYVSNDCGESWKLRWVKSGTDLATGQPSNSYFSPVSGDWAEIEIDNFPVADMVDNVIMKFVFESGGGNELYIDNILIAGVYKDVPVLNFPENGQNNIAQKVRLDWKPIFGVSGYEYEIDTDTSFSSPDLQTDYLDYISVEAFNEDTEVELDLTRGTTYYWRVRSYFNQDVSDWSETWSFTVSANGQGDTLSVREMPDITIGSDEHSQAPEMKVFPNPLSEGSTLFIALDKPLSGQLQMINSLGQIVYRNAFNDQMILEVDATILPKGLHWLNLKTEDHIYNQSIVVE